MRNHVRSVFLALMLVPTPAAVTQEAPVRLELMSRIGCVDCAGPTMLTNVHDIAIAGNRVYVLDASAPYVRGFDDQGRPVTAFGRQGRGPGEFRFPILVTIRPAGELEVFDYGLGRFTRFDSVGSQLATRTVSLGQFPVLCSRSDNPATYIVTSDIRDTSQRLMRLGDHDSTATILPAFGASLPIDPRSASVARPVLAARPGAGIAIGDGRDEYRIRVLREDGSAALDIVRNIERVRKTRAEIAADRAVQERLREQMAVQVPRARLPSVGVNEFRRHFSAIEYDDQNRLWVRTHRGDPDTTVFDLFGRSGEYLGELKVAGQLSTFALGGGRLAAVTKSEDGVPYVILWRVR